MPTFLFTDLDDAAGAMAALGDAYESALADLRAIVTGACRDHHGDDIRAEGTNILAAFDDPVAALSVATEVHRSLAAHAWPSGYAVRIRTGIHTGHATLTPAGYVGIGLNETARICYVTHGGQILTSQDTLDAVSDRLSAEWTMKSVGRHKLKDFVTAMPLFQVGGPGLANDFAPVGGTKNHLPTGGSPLVGREAECEAVIAALESDARVVSVIGPTGVGATRVAVEGVAMLAARYPDGVWYADLGAASGPEGAIAGVAEAFGLDATADAETVNHHLDGKKALLVLANFGPVEAAAHVIPQVVATAPDSRVVVSCREALMVSGERQVPVAPLSTEPGGDAQALLAELVTSTAVSGSNDDAATLCARLDGLPLAIELAAAALASRSAPDLLTDLDEAALPGWLADLGAALDGQCRYLSERDATLYQRLAVFDDQFSLMDVEAVCSGGAVDDWAVFEILDSLVAKNLVIAADVDFTMLNTTRAHARMRLAASGELADLTARRDELTSA